MNPTRMSAHVMNQTFMNVHVMNKTCVLLLPTPKIQKYKKQQDIPDKMKTRKSHN